MEKKKKFQMPHTYIIIFGVILFAAILTMFIPAISVCLKIIPGPIMRSWQT